MLRYVVASLLGALLLMLVGLVFGYLVLDFTASEERQLTAAGALAYYECDEYECWWIDEGDWARDEEAYLQLPPDVEPPDVLDIDGELYVRDDSEDLDEEDLLLLGEPNGFFEDAPYLHEPGFWSDEWWVEDGYWVVEPVYVEQRPWYVSSFPGIGSFVQQIIPGLHGGTVRPTPPSPSRPTYPQPSCWIAAEPMSVEYGRSSTLRWSSFNATRATLTDFGTVPLSGSRIAQNITNERVYQLNVSGQGGSGSCYTRITLKQGSSAPSCVISANPSSISVGQDSSLAWGSHNASSAYLSGVGSVSPTGGTYVAPQQTSTYTLTVFGSGGTSYACTTDIGVLP